MITRRCLLSTKQVDHIKFINGLKAKGYKQLGNKPIPINSTGKEYEAWKREEVIFVPPKPINFMGYGKIVLLVTFNTNKTAVLQALPSIYLDEPFNVCVPCSKTEGLSVYYRTSNPEQDIIEALGQLDTSIEKFISELEHLNSIIFTPEIMNDIGKKILIERFTANYFKHEVLIDFKKTKASEIFSVNDEARKLLKRDTPITALDAYIIIFINILSSKFLKMSVIGYSNGAKELTSHEVRSNVNSLPRKRLLRAFLSEVFEESFPIIRPVVEFRMENYTNT